MKWVIIYQRDGKQLILGFEKRNQWSCDDKKAKGKNNNRGINTFHQAQKWDGNNKKKKKRLKAPKYDGGRDGEGKEEKKFPPKEWKQYRTIAP